MKKFILIIIIFPAIGFCEGPLFLHKDTTDQQEFENVYQDLRKIPHLPGFAVTTSTGTTVSAVSQSLSSFLDTGLTATINIKYSSSKILIQLNQTCDLSASGLTGSLQILRNNSVVYGPYPYFTSIGNFQSMTIPISFYDAPSTTGDFTYKTQMALTSGSGTMTCQDSFSTVHTQSQIFLMEITQ